MNLTANIHRKRVAVTGAVAAAGIGVGLFVAPLLDAGAETADVPVSAPENDPAPGAPADGRRSGTITAAYVGPTELVFAADGGDAASLPVAGDVVVTTLDESGGSVAVDYDRFTLLVHRGETAGSIFEITTADGFVVEIHEQRGR